MNVLITGGAGYIGSTIASACLDAGHQVVILDDLSAGRREFTEGRTFYEGDIADERLLDRIFSEHRIDAVVHCAAKIIVPESVAEPLLYYHNNVAKTVTLLEALQRNGVNRLLFSSSASVYGDPKDGFAVTEQAEVQASGSPYARTKLMMEQVLKDTALAGDLRVIALRYFNPIGADPQLRTGQQIEHPSHVLGKMMDAWFEHSPFTITGVDWDTRDGSGIRDYIHVWDLALAHVAALEHFDDVTAGEPFQVINIGTGNGVTVRELAEAFQQATGEPLQVAEGPARPGDVIGAYAVADKARELLSWQAQRSMADGIHDAIAWVPERRRKLGY